MNIRIRAILVIILTNLIIILFSVFTGIKYVEENIEMSLKIDLAVKAHLADYYISAELDNLKLKARWAAETLKEIEEINWPPVLARQLELNPEFIGMSVFSSEGHLIAEGIKSPAESGAIHDKYLNTLFLQAGNLRPDSGGVAVSSTIPTDNGVVFCLALPLLSSRTNTDERILIVTLPGTYFRQLLSRFRIWDTGHIYLSDVDGYAISNPRENWVQERFNYIHAAQINEDFVELAETVTRMTRGESGTGRYTVYGILCVSSFRPVSGSEESWSLGVVAPLTESPVRNIDIRLMVVALVCIILNVLAAIIASDFIKKPFEKFAMLKEEADAANRAKSAFLSTMSHEMRTPLNAVIGLSELILNTGQTSQQAAWGEVKDRLVKIHNSGMTLFGIVNDILDISKIESGKFELHPIKYDTPSLINDIVSLNDVYIGEKPIQFILTLDENLPEYLYGDDLRIKQIFNNLLSNAFKYTNSGTVEWKVSFERDGDSVWLISEVRDTGIGIKSEDIPKLFKDYSQVDAETNRKTEGTGLGLSITKRLVELMDGTITVESEYGKGLAVHVRLRQEFVSGIPIGQKTAMNLMGGRFIDNKRTQNANLIRIDLSYASVLVVDDVQTNLDVAKGMLMPYKLRVDCALSGRQAIDMIRAAGGAENTRYDAVFMDHMMPGMDGIEAVRIIREEIGADYARNVPIIALTANATTGNENMFLEHGFQAFISKPIDAQRLDSVLRQWVRNKNMEKELSAGPKPKPALAETFTLPFDDVDTAAGLGRFAGNEEVYKNVLKSYVTNTRSLLEGLNGHLEKENLTDYAILVHGIKGSSFGVGAMGLGAKAERLENLAKAGEKERVLAENSSFVESVKTLLDSIDSALSVYKSQADRPVATEPDPALLRELREASAEYDVGKIDRIMALLDSFEYEKGAELVAWLKGQVEDMNFREIAEGGWKDRAAFQKNRVDRGENSG